MKILVTGGTGMLGKALRDRLEACKTPTEVTDVLAAIKDERFRDVVQLLWETGCRPQEACALEARHVDLTLQRADVEQHLCCKSRSASVQAQMESDVVDGWEVN